MLPLFVLLRRFRVQFFDYLQLLLIHRLAATASGALTSLVSTVHRGRLLSRLLTQMTCGIVPFNILFVFEIAGRPWLHLLLAN